MLFIFILQGGLYRAQLLLIFECEGARTKKDIHFLYSPNSQKLVFYLFVVVPLEVHRIIPSCKFASLKVLYTTNSTAGVTKQLMTDENKAGHNQRACK